MIWRVNASLLLLIACGGPVAPCDGKVFFGMYQHCCENELLEIDYPAFTRLYETGRDLGGVDVCKDDMIVLRVIASAREGVWQTSMPGGWLVRWVGRDDGKTLVLSDGSIWLPQ